ncbi:GNAT family N-acetyltransferase [Rhodococcoides yunnanense]|uniref:GNAT family N-acetyltransferase n=1 Tax=Rhodococcoides yunnanense TaxID=278209 RepID=UPI000932298B|nr:GNAT family N-acetyltransferase [Rhodococcus yunnanensis]
MSVEIRLATSADIPAMSAMMSRAFQVDDPVSGYFFPDDRRRPTQQRRMMSALIRHRYLPVGGADVAVVDGVIVGVSLWHPHDAPPDPWWRMLISGPHLLWAMGRGVRAGIQMDRVLDAGAPDPEAVLWVYLGVEPSLHRSGVGRRLTRAMVDRCDRDGRTMYGICKEGNLPFWTEMGFVEAETVTIGPKGPLVYRVNRPPAQVTSEP